LLPLDNVGVYIVDFVWMHAHLVALFRMPYVYCAVALHSCTLDNIVRMYAAQWLTVATACRSLQQWPCLAAALLTAAAAGCSNTIA